MELGGEVTAALPGIPSVADLVAAYREHAMPSHVHGPAHVVRVARNGLALAVDADPGVVLAFALLHDACRENDYDDPEHGPRAAALVQDLQAAGRLTFEGDRLALLLEAVHDHASGRTSPDPTIGACWDADRLDVSRVRLAPRPDLMSTPRGRLLAEGGRPLADRSWASLVHEYAQRVTGEATTVQVYHGTSSTIARVIQREGLRPRGATPVFLSTDGPDALWFALRAACAERNRRPRPQAVVLTIEVDASVLLYDIRYPDRHRVSFSPIPAAAVVDARTFAPDVVLRGMTAADAARVRAAGKLKAGEARADIAYFRNEVAVRERFRPLHA